MNKNKVEAFYLYEKYNNASTNLNSMSNKRDSRNHGVKRNRNFSLWAAIGAIVLIILLFIWLTMADLWGDTDVAAYAIPGMIV